MAGEGAISDGTRLNSVNLLSMILTEGPSPPLDLLEQLLLDESSSPSVRELELQHQYEAAQELIANLERQLESANDAAAQLRTRHSLLRQNFVTLHRVAARSLAERDATIRDLNKRLNDLEQSAASCRHRPISSVDVLVKSTSTPSDEAIGTRPPHLVSHNAPASDVVSASRVSRLDENSKSPAVQCLHLDRELLTNSSSSGQQTDNINNALLQTTAQKEVIDDPLRPVPAAAATTSTARIDVISPSPMDFSDTLGPCDTGVVNESSSQSVATSAKNIITVSEQKSCNSTDSISLPGGAALLSLISLLPCQSATVKQSSADARDVVGTLDPDVNRRVLKAETKILENDNLTFAKVSAVKDRRMEKDGISTVTGDSGGGISLEKKGTESQLEFTCSSRGNLSGPPKSTTNRKTFPTQDHNSGKKWTDPVKKPENVVQVGLSKVGHNCDGELNNSGKTSEKSTANVESEADLRTCSTEKSECTLPLSKKRSRESDRFNSAGVDTENSGKLSVKRPKSDDTVAGMSANVKTPISKVAPSKLTTESPQTPGLTDSERLVCYKVLSKERETEQRKSFRESERHRRQVIPDVKVSAVDKVDDVGPPPNDFEPTRKPNRSKSGTNSMMPSTPSIFTVRGQQKITKLRQERELEKAATAAAIMDVDKSVADNCRPDRCENSIKPASVTLCASTIPVAAQTVNATKADSISSKNNAEDHLAAPLKSFTTNDGVRAVSSLSVGVAGISESLDVVDSKSPTATLPANVDKVKLRSAQKPLDRRLSSDCNKTSKDAAQKSGSVAVSCSSSKSAVKVGSSGTRRRESCDKEGKHNESRAPVIETSSCEEKNQKKMDASSLPEGRDVVPPDVAVTTSLSRSSNDLKRRTSKDVENNLRTENSDKLPDVVCPKDVKLLNTGAPVAVDDRKQNSRRSNRDTSRCKSTKTSSGVSDKVKSANVQHSDSRSSGKREEISAGKCSIISGQCGERNEGKELVEKAEECENPTTERQRSVAESSQQSHRSSTERNTESRKKVNDKDTVSTRKCNTDGSERTAALHVASKILSADDANVSTRVSNAADGQNQSVSSDNVSAEHSLRVVQDSLVNSASCATSAPAEARLVHSGVVSPRNFSKQSFISPNRDNSGTDVFGIAARQTRIKEATQNKSPVAEVQRAGAMGVQLSPTFKSPNEPHSATKALDDSSENSLVSKRLQLSAEDISVDHNSVAGPTGILHVPSSLVSILPAAEGSGQVTPCRQPGIIRTNRPSLNISDSCVDFVSNPSPTTLPGSPNVSYLTGKTPVDTFSSGEDLFDVAIAGRTPAQLPSDDTTNDGCDSIMSPLFNDCNAIDDYYGDIESGNIDRDIGNGNKNHVTGDFIAASSDNQHVSFDGSFTGSGLPCTCDHSDPEFCSSCSTCLNANSRQPELPDTVHSDDRQRSKNAGKNVTEVRVDAANVNPNSPQGVKSPAEPFRIFRQSSDRDNETIDSSIEQQQQPVVGDAALDESRSDIDSDNEEDKCSKMDPSDEDVSPCRTIRIEGEGIIFECAPDSEAEDSNTAACSPLSTPEKKSPASGAGVTTQSTRGNSRGQQPVLLLAEDCNSVYRLFGEVSESESEQSDASPVSQKRKDNQRNVAKSNPTEQTTSLGLEIPKPDVEDGEITDSDVEPIRRNAASCSSKIGDKENMKETPKKRRPIGSTSDRTLVRRSSNERRPQGQKDSPVEGSRRDLKHRRISSDDARRRDSHRSSREVDKRSKSRSPLRSDVRSSGTARRRSPLLSSRVKGVSRAVNGRSENRFGQSSRRWASIGFGKRRRN